MQNSTQFAQKLLKYEGKLYSQNQEIQIQTLQELKVELGGQHNHQSLLNMIAKYFAYTGSLYQRIKIIELIKDNFSTLYNNIADWNQIIGYLTQECHSNNHQFRMLSLHALNTIIPVLKEQYQTFHISIFEIFIKANYSKELYIASLTLINIVKQHHSYLFMNKLNQISSIQHFKTKKLTILLKCVLFASAQFYLYEQQILDFLINVKNQIQNQIDQKEVLHLIYQYLKIAYLFKDQEQFIKNIMQKQEIINHIQECSENIQELIKQQLKQYSIDIQIKSEDTLFSKKSIAQNKCENLLQYSINLGTSHLLNFLDNLFYAYTYACHSIVTTVSQQQEKDMSDKLLQLDNVIYELFKKHYFDEKKEFSFQVKCLKKIILLSIQLYSAQFALKDQSIELSLKKIIEIVKDNLQFNFLIIKLLFSINKPNDANLIINSLQNIPCYTQIYFQYLQSLNNYDEFCQWNNFQIDSTQYIIRQQIMDYYQQFKNQLEQIENQTLLEDNKQQIIISLLSLIDQTTSLKARIEFFSNEIYADEATFLQFIVLEKICLWIQRKCFDIEIESLYENSNIVIQKLIEYNKGNFIKSFLPNLRSEKLKEFINQMKQSIYNYPKIMLQLIQTPTIKINCFIKEQQYSSVLLRFIGQLISKEPKNDCIFYLTIRSKGEEQRIKMKVKEQQAIIDIVFSKNSSVTYYLQCYYQGLLVLQTKNEQYIIQS